MNELYDKFCKKDAKKMERSDYLDKEDLGKFCGYYIAPKLSRYIKDFAKENGIEPEQNDIKLYTKLLNRKDLKDGEHSRVKRQRINESVSRSR